MLDITNIPPPRVPLIDGRTGLMSREWYRFFLSLFRLTGSGANDITLEDLQIGPDQGLIKDEIAKAISEGQLSGPSSPELGTLASQNADNVRLIGFSTNPSPAIPNPAPTGTLYWDGNSTLGLQMSQTTLAKIGQAQFVYVKASSSITKGQLCYHTGSVGASGVITAAPTPINLTDTTQIIGIASESIALNAFGFIQISGDLRGFDTSGTGVGEVWADGNALYYNPSFVGSMTNTKPSAPSIKTYIGEVINASPGGAGSINIRVVYGSSLGGTDSNVQFSGVANGNIIQYDGTLGYWKNITTLPATSGGTGLTSFTANGVVYANTTTTLTTGSGLTFDSTNLGLGVTPSAWATLKAIEIARVGSAVAANATNGNLTISANAYFNSGFIYANTGSFAARYTVSASAGTHAWFTAPSGTAGGAVTFTQVMTITNSGNIHSVSGTTGMTDGFFYIPAAAGAPTGVPTAISGSVPMYYDTTNNKFYVYNGAWKSVILT